LILKNKTKNNNKKQTTKCGFDVFLMVAGVAEAIIRKSALNFVEHISANTPKFNPYRL